MTLDAVEFVRRFLLHVLPCRLREIRHFGLLANRNRRRALALCRVHLCATTADLAHCSPNSNSMRSTDPVPSVGAAPCTSSHTISLIAAQPRTLLLTRAAVDSS